MKKALFLLILLVNIAYAADLELITYLEDTVNTQTEYTKLFKLKNLYPKLGKVYNITVYYNITQENDTVKADYFIKPEVNHYSTTKTGLFTPTSAGNYTLCGSIINSTDNNTLNNNACKNLTVIDTSMKQCNISLNISVEKLLYQEGEKIQYRYQISNKTYHYAIEYWAEDLHGNIEKKHYNSSNDNPRSWTPKKLHGAYFLKGRISQLACNDSYKQDNHAEHLVIINGSIKDNKNLNPESSIMVENIYLGSDDSVRFGATVRARLKIHKGDTDKKQVKVYIEGEEKISKVQTTFNLDKKFQDYTLTIPIQLKPNCDREYDYGTYSLVVEGLGAKTKQDIDVWGVSKDLCHYKCRCIQENETQKIDCENKKETSKILKEKETQIKSFYTRAKKPSETINLFASAEDTKNGTIMTLYHHNNTITKNLTLEQKTVKFPVKLTPGKNTFILTVNNGTDIHDVREFTFDNNITKTAEETVPQFPAERQELIYESTSEKAQKLSSYFLISILALLTIFLMIKKTPAF